MAAIKPDAKTKVLIVEDEVAIVTLLRYNLEKEGFAVISTGDGEEAVNLVKEHRPDIIVLDWMLPGMTGVEVCKHIRWNQDLKNNPHHYAFRAWGGGGPHSWPRFRRG